MSFGIESFNAQLAHRIGIKEAIFVCAIEEAFDCESGFSRTENNGVLWVNIPYDALIDRLFFFASQGRDKEGLQDEVSKVMESAIKQDAVHVCQKSLEEGELWFRLPIEKSKPRPKVATRPTNDQGQIYFIRESSQGHVKIGKTKDLGNRLKTFEVKLPFKVEPIHTITVTNRHTAEAILHAHYASNRVDGEWFALDAGDLERVQSRGFLESLGIEYL